MEFALLPNSFNLELPQKEYSNPILPFFRKLYSILFGTLIIPHKKQKCQYFLANKKKQKDGISVLLLFQRLPPSRVIGKIETLPCKAVSCPWLYCSQRPLCKRDKSIALQRGGLQTTTELCPDSFNSTVGPFTRSSRTKQDDRFEISSRCPRRSRSPRKRDRQSSRLRRQTRRHRLPTQASPRRPPSPT